MPSVRTTTTVAIATTVDNLMQGNTFEFVSRPTQVQIWASCEDTADILLSVSFGERLLARNLRLNTAAVGIINMQADQVLDEVVLPGERLTIAVQNTDAAATRFVNWFVKLTPIA